jgi:probable rRNA maturation factor
MPHTLDTLEWVSLDPLPELDLPPLTLNILTLPSLLPQWQPAMHACALAFKAGWPSLLTQLLNRNLCQAQGISPNKPWEADVLFVDNDTMQALNHQYRNKNQPTDVLTFTMFADAADKAMLSQLPMHHLGAFAVSLEWAMDAVAPKPEALQFEIQAGVGGNFTPSSVFIKYILERMVHGGLHLMGVTHDTDIDYNRVVEIQQHVLNQVTG